MLPYLSLCNSDTTSVYQYSLVDIDTFLLARIVSTLRQVITDCNSMSYCLQKSIDSLPESGEKDMGLANYSR